MKFETTEQRDAIETEICKIFASDWGRIRRVDIREDNCVFVELMSALMPTGQYNYDTDVDEVPEDLHVATYEQIHALAKLLPGHQIYLIPCTSTSQNYPTLTIFARPK